MLINCYPVDPHALFACLPLRGNGALSVRALRCPPTTHGVTLGRAPAVWGLIATKRASGTKDYGIRRNAVLLEVCRQQSTVEWRTIEPGDDDNGSWVYGL